MFPWTTPPTTWPSTSPPTTTASTWPPTPTFRYHVFKTTIRMANNTNTIAPSYTTPHPGYPLDPHHFSISSTTTPAATSNPAEHLFGQPSSLHPTWPPTTSLPTTTSATPPPTFSSLATASHTLPHHISHLYLRPRVPRLQVSQPLHNL